MIFEEENGNSNSVISFFRSWIDQQEQNRISNKRGKFALDSGYGENRNYPSYDYPGSEISHSITHSMIGTLFVRSKNVDYLSFR